MPRVRRGPNGPRSSAGGKGTGSQPKAKGKGSGKTPSMNKGTKGGYSKKGY